MMRVVPPELAIVLGICLALGAASPCFAVEPDEILKNPVLETRARTLSEDLRGLVCQNESIDESHADLARDIRILVRQRLQAGDTDAQIRAYLVARYGTFILLRPPVEPRTLLLWGTPLLVLFAGGCAMLVALRRRPGGDPARPLSAVEQERLAEIVGDAGARPHPL